MYHPLSSYSMHWILPDCTLDSCHNFRKGNECIMCHGHPVASDVLGHGQCYQGRRGSGGDHRMLGQLRKLAKKRHTVAGCLGVTTPKMRHHEASSLANSILSVVKDEQKYAAESYRQEPELLEGPPNGFDVEDASGSRAVYLLKVHKNQEQIVVSMDIQEQQQDDMEVDDDGSAVDEDAEEDDDDALPAVNFKVQVSKPSGVLSFQCTCDGHYVVIKELALITPGQYDDGDEEDEDEEVDEDELYTGPPFSELDDTLQLAFLDYLEERGVNADLGRYLQLQHADKAAKEYQAWLARMHDFIAS